MTAKVLTGMPVEILEKDDFMTQHAEQRMQNRGIPRKAVLAAMLFGRTVHVRGADIHVIGRKEIRRSRLEGVDLSDYDGVHVVCAGNGSVLTVYRNHELRGLRPRGRHQYFRRATAYESTNQDSGSTSYGVRSGADFQLDDEAIRIA